MKGHPAAAAAGVKIYASPQFWCAIAVCLQIFCQFGIGNNNNNNQVNAWNTFRNVDAKSFIAKVWFTLGNSTVSWKIPSSAYKNRVVVVVNTTGATSGKPVTTTTTLSTTTTTARAPTTTTAASEIGQNGQCTQKSCESDDLEILENCQSFCLEQISGDSDHPALPVPEAITADAPPDYQHPSPTINSTTSTPPCNGDDCTCNYELTPLCGSDGKTYANPCTLECGKKCRPELVISHYGHCEGR